MIALTMIGAILHTVCDRYFLAWLFDIHGWIWHTSKLLLAFPLGKERERKKIDCMPEHAILYPDELVRREGYYVLTPPLH